MRVRVRLFAAAKQAAGCDVIELELPEQATVRELRQALGRDYPQVDRTARHSLFAVDNQYADDNTPLAAGREVACIPPVSGG